MTFDTFNVDTASLRQQGQRFTALGGDLASASKRLQGVLEGIGEPWADAEFGEIFGQVYAPIRDGLFTSMDSLAERLQQIGHNLQDNARNYEASDASNSSLLDKISGQI
ncbi:WXG100 family type VII secretion target [Streptomyces sp. NPDC012935]|uniref:WXG100 family type VII secretion target n=1 Tax=Streptomyces sp. NPDC012935 TaxID=3364857 RepID=UPI0036C558CA